MGNTRETQLGLIRYNTWDRQSKAGNNANINSGTQHTTQGTRERRRDKTLKLENHSGAIE